MTINMAQVIGKSALRLFLFVFFGQDFPRAQLSTAYPQIRPRVIHNCPVDSQKLILFRLRNEILFDIMTIVFLLCCKFRVRVQ